MASTHQVYVGAVGWTHPHWQGGFYPDDLPEDWLLSYYNTQFQAVYLPAPVWERASDDTWRQWLYDSQDSFCFVLEPGAGQVAPPVSDRVVPASARWTDEHVWWLDERPDMRALAESIARHAAAAEPLFVFSRCGDLGLMQQVNTLKQVMGY